MASKLHVLVVDDASFTRDLIKKGVKLGYPGFAIHEAANGRQAQAKLESGGFDLVLCDWEMPEVSGLEVLAWMREQEHLADTPFVMVTSRGDRENVVEAIQKGATNYIVKPFTNEKIFEVVTKALTKSRGISPKALKKLGGAAAEPSNDSASVLAGGLSGDLNVAEHLDADQESPSQQRKERAVPKHKVIAQIRYAGGTLGCLVREVDFYHLVAMVKRPDPMPTLLEQATFDFTTEEDGRTSRINAYIYALQAGEKRQDTDIVRVTLRFVDDDQDKQDHLAYYFSIIDG